jgi:hypothetical protein
MPRLILRSYSSLLHPFTPQQLVLVTILMSCSNRHQSSGIMHLLIRLILLLFLLCLLCLHRCSCSFKHQHQARRALPRIRHLHQQTYPCRMRLFPVRHLHQDWIRFLVLCTCWTTLHWHLGMIRLTYMPQPQHLGMTKLPPARTCCLLDRVPLL